VLPDSEEDEALCPELLQLLLRERRRRLRRTTGRKHAGLVVYSLMTDEVEASGPSFFYAMAMKIAIDA
jgi:hypothetical protein